MLPVVFRVKLLLAADGGAHRLSAALARIRAANAGKPLALRSGRSYPGPGNGSGGRATRVQELVVGF